MDISSPDGTRSDYEFRREAGSGSRTQNLPLLALSEQLAPRIQRGREGLPAPAPGLGSRGRPIILHTDRRSHQYRGARGARSFTQRSGEWCGRIPGVTLQWTFCRQMVLAAAPASKTFPSSLIPNCWLPESNVVEKGCPRPHLSPVSRTTYRPAH